MDQEQQDRVTAVEFERHCSKVNSDIMNLRLEMKDMQMNYVEKDAEAVSEIMNELNKRLEVVREDYEKSISHCHGIVKISTLDTRLDSTRREIQIEFSNLKNEIQKLNDFKEKFTMAIVGAFISAGISVLFLILNLIFTLRKG